MSDDSSKCPIVDTSISGTASETLFSWPAPSATSPKPWERLKCAYIKRNTHTISHYNVKEAVACSHDGCTHCKHSEGGYTVKPHCKIDSVDV
jgi:hypothetical protein